MKILNDLDKLAKTAEKIRNPKKENEKDVSRETSK